MKPACKHLYIDLLIIIGIIAVVFLIGGCKEDEEPAPDYIIIPVLEISNPELGRKIMGVEAHFTITVNGDSLKYTVYRDLVESSKLLCRKGIMGRVIEYEGNAHLTFRTEVLYQRTGTKGYEPWDTRFSYSNAFTLTFEVREGLRQGLVAPGKFITSTEDDQEPTLDWVVKNVFGDYD